MTLTNNNLRGNGQPQAVQKIEASLQLLPLIMNNIPQAVFWKDQNLVFLGCNQAFVEDAGLTSPEDIIGKTDFDMPWKDHAELYRADDRLVMESGELKINYEEPHTTSDGSRTWVRTSKIPVYEKGQIVAVLGMYEDITEHKQAEQTLRESQQILQTVMDNIPQSIFWKDSNLTYLGCNKAFADDAGLASPRDIIGKTDWDMPWKAQAELYRADDSLVMKRGIPKLNYEEPQTTPDGSTIWLRTSKVPLYDSIGNISAVLGMYEDITERKQAEEATRKSEENFRAIADFTYGWETWLNPEGKYLYVSPACERISEYTPNEFIDDPLLFAKIAHSDDKLLIENHLHDHRSTADTKPIEYRIITKNGNVRWISHSCQTIYDSTGTWQGRRGSNLDITERKRTEEFLQKSEANLSSALHVAQMGHWEFDIPTGMFTFNDQYYSLHGTTAQEVGGYQMSVQRFAQEFVHPEDAPIVGQATQQAIETTDPNFHVQIEARILHADGEPRWVTVWFRVEKDAQGRTIKLHGVNQDITGRKHLEQQVQTAFERRGLQVQLSTQVSQSIASASSLEDLYQRVVTQVKEHFGYYHAQILRYDAAQEAVVLVTGYGEAGEKMLTAGHRLPMGAGLIGTAADTGETVLRPILENDPDWRPHPLLPDTKGEIAVPIKLGDKILGVLDVQSDVAGALGAGDQLLLEGLCGQIATAIEKTRLTQEMAERLEEINRLYQAMSHEGWQTYREAAAIPESFMFDQGGLRQVKDITLTEELFTNIPLTVPGGEVIGTLAIADDPQHPITAEDHTFLAQIAEQVALALESARLFEQTQEALLESEESQKLIRNVIDSTDDWIFVKDQQHRYQLVNQGYAKALHISVEDFIGKNDLELGFPEELVKGNPQKGIRGFWADDRLVIETGVPQHFPDDPAMIDGKVRVFDTIKIPLRDASGNIWGVLAFARDLTERKQAEKIIAQRAIQLETVATVSNTASTVLDPDKLLQAVVDLTKEKFGLYHVHIYLADESWNTLLLAAGANEVGRKMVAENHTISMDAETSLVARAARERTAVIVNDVRSDPNFLPNTLLPNTQSEMAVPMIIGDKVLGVFDVQSDVTGHFSGEDANIYSTLAAQIGVALQNARLYVEQAATVTQLRELDKLKSSFLANMSHELRTPLNSILGFTDVIMEGLDGPLTEHMDSDLRLIQKNGQHLLHLINDVLDMAKIEAGRMNLQPETFKVHALLEEVNSITSTLASEKNLALSIDENSDQEIEVYADNTRLRQVMINLVNNSIKFTEKGRIRLSAMPMEGGRVLITVQDTGIGIPPEKLEAIFQEFTQVDSSSTRKTGGTGLGLPISRRLVEMHGGRLWAESTGIPGEGSTFFVELPLEARITEVVEKQVK